MGVQVCLDGSALSDCDCTGGGAAGTGHVAGQGAGGGHDAGGHNNTTTHADAATDDDGGLVAGDGGAGAGGSTGSDAAVADAGADASTAQPTTYSGPCKNDKACPGDEQCETVGSLSYCTGECMKNSDCPDPESGKAMPVCVGANVLLSQPGTCALSCGLLSGDCPNGMECSDVLVLPGECVWDGTI